MKLLDGEAYPGELVALRGLYGTVRTIAEHGSMRELREAVAEHRAAEAEVWERSVSVPEEGGLYLVRGGEGEMPRVVRVVAAGVWRMRTGVGEASGEEQRAFWPLSPRRDERDYEEEVLPAGTTVGRLVLETASTEVGMRKQTQSLRAFGPPVIPKGLAGMGWWLSTLSAWAGAAGLTVNVRHANDLGELPGECR